MLADRLGADVAQQQGACICNQCMEDQQLLNKMLIESMI